MMKGAPKGRPSSLVGGAGAWTCRFGPSGPSGPRASTPSASEGGKSCPRNHRHLTPRPALAGEFAFARSALLVRRLAELKDAGEIAMERDVLTTAANRILNAVYEMQESLGIEAAAVGGVEP